MNGEGNPRGRPRLPSTDHAIFVAAAELIRERGYDGFSMAAVADRAGVAKTTVYRRWPTRAHLVIATLASVLRVSVLDSGDVRADMVAFARTLVTAMRAPGTRRLLAQLSLSSVQRPELGEALERLFIERRAAVLGTIRGAQQAGRLRRDLDLGLLIDQLTGAIHYRTVVRGDPLSDDYAERLVDAILDGARQPAGVGSGSR